MQQVRIGWCFTFLALDHLPVPGVDSASGVQAPASIPELYNLRSKGIATRGLWQKRGGSSPARGENAVKIVHVVYYLNC